MNANELRIGNIVSGRNDPEMIVHNIYKSGCVELAFIGMETDEAEEYGLWYYEVEELKPIPLTPEWLTRAGFVKEFDDVYSIGLPTGDGVDLLLEWGDCSLRRNHVGKEKKKGDKNPYDYAYIKSPKYVHQLQQLYFSLSGKELEFK